MTKEELKARISDSLKETLPLICQECHGGGSDGTNGRGGENCPECGGTGLSGFSNGYAEKLVLALAREFAAGELQKVKVELMLLSIPDMMTTRPYDVVEEAINSLTSPQ